MIAKPRNAQSTGKSLATGSQNGVTEKVAQLANKYWQTVEDSGLLFQLERETLVRGSYCDGFKAGAQYASRHCCRPAGCTCSERRLKRLRCHGL